MDGKVHRRKHKVLYKFFYFEFFRTNRNIKWFYSRLLRLCTLFASVNNRQSRLAWHCDVHFPSQGLFFHRSLQQNFIFASFPPLEWHEILLKMICIETLESDTIQAVKLRWSSFSSPFRVDFCLLKTVPSTLFHDDNLLNTNTREKETRNLYLSSFDRVCQ